MENDYLSSDVITILKIINIDTLSARRCLGHDNIELAMEILERQTNFILHMISTIENRKPE